MAFGVDTADYLSDINWANLKNWKGEYPNFAGRYFYAGYGWSLSEFATAKQDTNGMLNKIHPIQGAVGNKSRLEATGSTGYKYGVEDANAIAKEIELIIAHTNEAEYRAFVANPKNEALRSRIIVIPVPYNLRVSQEVKIYEKLIRQADVHVHLAPYALRTAAIFSVLSRLKESKKQGMDLVKKMKLYDGESVEGFRNKDVVELQAEAPDEGMNGIDPRYVINRISSALITKGVQCVNALDVLRALKDGLEQHPSITREEKNRFLNLLALARQEYDEVAKKEVQRAFVYSYEESAHALFENL